MSSFSAFKEFTCYDECEPPFACKGHSMQFDFNNTSDTGSVYLDEIKVFSGGMQHFRALNEVLHDLKELWD
jgi:hypothetical protein